MGIAVRLTNDAGDSLHPAWRDENLSSPIAGWLWYAGVIIVGASASTVGALVWVFAV